MKKSAINLASLDFSRIAIIGCPGSGKTTFSLQLKNLLNREVVHLDKLLWNSNWQLPSFEVRSQLHAQAISADKWIMDGMWKSHLEERLQRATLVIFLDYRRSLCLKRVLTRRIKYSGKQRADIADGCFEKLDSEFMQFVWNFNKCTRPQILRLTKQYNVQTVVLASPKQTKAFLQQLQNFLQQQSC